MQRVIFSVLCLILVVTAVHAAPIDDARLSGLAWLIKNQQGDGSWRGAAGLEVSQTAAAVETLVNSGLTKGNTYASAVAWLQSYQAYSTDSLSRQIIALYKAGWDTSGLVSQLISWRNDSTLSWGAYDHYSGSFPDTSLALDALQITTTFTTYVNTIDGINFITNKKNADGGWPYYPSDLGTPASKVIPTAQNLLTLNHYKNNYSIQSHINTGVKWLKAQQKTPGGGFGEGSSGTVLETALAYRALLTELGSTDPAVVNALSFLITQQQTDGSWLSNGVADPMLTTLILAAIPGTTLADSNNDGIPNALETANLLGSNPKNTLISKTIAKGNGQSISGTTTASSLAPAILNQPYTATLTTGSGTSLTSGRLPDGLSLSGNTISGTPSALGVFNFVYQTTINGSVVSSDSQIQVVASIQVPALPDWGMFLLALLLIMITKYVKKPVKPANT